MPNIDVHLVNMVTELWRKDEVPGLTPLLSALPGNRTEPRLGVGSAENCAAIEPGCCHPDCGSNG